MLRGFRFVATLGVGATFITSQIAEAAPWSIEADCKNGDWTVDVELTGFGVVDASCTDDAATDLLVDAGDAVVTGVGIAATSTAGTVCDLPIGGDFKATLECGSKTEDTAGLEVEDELEVEVELEDEEEEEVEEE